MIEFSRSTAITSPEAVVTTPEAFRSHVEAEVAKWAKVVEASGAKAD